MTGKSAPTKIDHSENPNARFIDAQMKLFTIRCTQLADRVMANQIAFVDAVDVAYEAAIWSGLAQSIGDDGVQIIMAAAFAGTPREGDA
jgi:hypothetical protein